MENPQKPKRKMQQVSFKTLDDFWEFLPADEKLICRKLRALVLDCIPLATEQLSYNVLYFKGHRMICFIWPASVGWGENQNWKGVRFGFAYGNYLVDEEVYWDKGSRKQVVWKDYQSISEIQSDIIKDFLFQAYELDQGPKPK